MIALIAAAAENNALGKDNRMLWHLPDDFKRFKQITTGHPIIMGRKTFESFPQLLPNRKHIIITRQENYNPADCIVVNSMEAAIKAANSDSIYVIGGGEIYTLALSFADVIELTRVHASFDADAYFPEIDATKWKLQTSEYHPKDERHSIDFTYETFVRKQ